MFHSKKRKQFGVHRGKLYRGKLRLVFLLIFFISTICVAVVAWKGTHSARPVNSTSIPANLFGMHIHYAATKTPWPAVPFGTWRLMDAYVIWPNLEPQKGEWHFETLDKYLDLAKQRNVEILLPLGFTPQWASARPKEPSSYSLGWAAEPSDIQDWRNYVRTVATRYKGKIHYYEIWNEPNAKSFFSGIPSQMVMLAREAYLILKQVDPSVTVVSPAAVTGGDRSGLRWLDKYLSKGGGAYADAIGYHFYVYPNAPEAVVPLISQVRQIISKHGLSKKPLWNTESGWSKPKVFSSDAEAAAYVARSYILNWAGGVSRFYWYAWDNRKFVTLYMTKTDRKTLTPAATAYAQVQKWLVGAKMTACQTNRQKTWTCQLSRDGGYRAWIIWNPERQLIFRVPRNWSVQQVRNLTGRKYNLTAVADLKIGSSPVLLETLAQ